MEASRLLLIPGLTRLELGSEAIQSASGVFTVRHGSPEHLNFAAGPDASVHDQLRKREDPEELRCSHLVSLHGQVKTQEDYAVQFLVPGEGVLNESSDALALGQIKPDGASIL